jgi:hypothetical protein
MSPEGRCQGIEGSIDVNYVRKKVVFVYRRGETLDSFSNANPPAREWITSGGSAHFAEVMFHSVRQRDQ